MEETKLETQKKDHKELWRVIKFTLFSMSAGIIELVTVTILEKATDWRHFYCYLIGLVLSVLWNFTLNRKYTFKSATNVPIAMLKVAAFYLVFTPFSTWLDKIITEDTPFAGTAWIGTVSTIICMLLNFVTEFLYDRFFVFGNSIDTNEEAKEEAAEEEVEREVHFETPQYESPNAGMMKNVEKESEDKYIL